MSRYAAPEEQLVVEVFVRDIGRSKAFYRRLGFEILRDSGPFVVLGWERSRLFLDERRDLPPPAAEPRANVRILVKDVDAFWRLAQEMEAPVTSPIADRYYGLRDFTIADPDGFGLRFASWLPDSEES